MEGEVILIWEADKLSCQSVERWFSLVVHSKPLNFTLKQPSCAHVLLFWLCDWVGD